MGSMTGLRTFRGRKVWLWAEVEGKMKSWEAGDAVVGWRSWWSLQPPGWVVEE